MKQFPEHFEYKSTAIYAKENIQKFTPKTYSFLKVSGGRVEVKSTIWRQSLKIKSLKFLSTEGFNFSFVH